MYLKFYNGAMFKDWKPTPADYLIFVGLVVNLAVIFFLVVYYFTR